MLLIAGRGSWLQKMARRQQWPRLRCRGRGMAAVAATTATAEVVRHGGYGKLVLDVLDISGVSSFLVSF